MSGLKAKDDWEVFCWIIDKIIELRAAAAKPALKASKDREPEDGPNVKYLRGAWELGEDGVARMCADPAEAGSGEAPLKLVRIAGGVGDDPQGHANSK